MTLIGLLQRVLSFGGPAVHWVASRGDAAALQMLVTEFGLQGTEALQAGDQNGLTPAHHAAKGGHAEVIRVLIREGQVPVEVLRAADQNGLTPAHHAVKGGHAEALRALGECAPGEAGSGVLSVPQRVMEQLEKELYLTCL